MLNISRKPHEAEASFRNRHHRFAQQQWFESWDFSHLLAFIIRGKWLADHSSWLATLITSDSRITWNYLLLLLSIISLLLLFSGWLILHDLCWHFSCWSFNQTGVGFSPWGIGLWRQLRQWGQDLMDLGRRCNVKFPSSKMPLSIGGISPNLGFEAS